MKDKMAESTMEKGAEALSPQEEAKTDDTTASRSFKAIVLGATGATGRYVVGELLASKDFKEVVLLGRRKFTELPEIFKIDLDKEESSGHLKQIIIDLEQANEESSLKYFEGMDAYFTCFGTTRANAGSSANFRHIDYGYNVKFAEMAKKAGIGFCSLLSSSGAHPRSYINYLKVKGEIEDVYTKLEFPFLTIFKPGILDRKLRQRLLEKIAGIFMTKMPVDTLAKAIVIDALNQLKKEKQDDRHSHILSNHQIFDLAKECGKNQEPGSAATASTERGEGKVETPKEVKPELDKSDEGKSEESQTIEGKPEEGNTDQGKAEESIGNTDQGKAEESVASESNEGKITEEQPKESEDKSEEPAKDGANEMDQTTKEGDQAE